MTMTMWRIRVAVPDDPGSRGALASVLAGQPGSHHVRDMEPSATTEIMVELAQDDSLATMLCALHEISPQVFIIRADKPAGLAAEGAGELRGSPV